MRLGVSVRVCAYARVRVCVCASVRVCVCACVRARVCVCVWRVALCAGPLGAPPALYASAFRRTLTPPAARLLLRVEVQSSVLNCIRRVDPSVFPYSDFSFV